jgi:hypothetical protein
MYAIMHAIPISYIVLFMDGRGKEEMGAVFSRLKH